jgi:hypothetical protein
MVQTQLEVAGLTAVLGPCVGKATDGDARSRAVMMQQMYGLHNGEGSGRRFRAVSHPSFMFSGLLHTINGIEYLTHCHMMDFLHSKLLEKHELEWRFVYKLVYYVHSGERLCIGGSLSSMLLLFLLPLRSFQAYIRSTGQETQGSRHGKVQHQS